MHSIENVKIHLGPTFYETMPMIFNVMIRLNLPFTFVGNVTQIAYIAIIN